MTQSSNIRSIGIDIGTTTTHLVISELELANVARGNEVPKLQVLTRKLLYQSPIHFTPLDSASAIDAKAITALVESEIANAQFSASEIQSGAVIITGETAKKRNAAQLVKELAACAGDFVVAAAGPNLESLLSGKGSGAEAYSRDNSKTICNIDIGGGTTNFSVFKNGTCVDYTCLGLGGRFIQLDSEYFVKALTDSAEDFLDGVAKLKLIKIGKQLEKETAQLFCNLLSEVILHTCTRKKAPQIVQRLLQTDPLKLDYQIDEYWFSGGVAECMAAPQQADIPYGDMGNLLARSLLKALDERDLLYRIAPDGIRATVIGAGSHSLQISGHTVTVSSTDCLPLRNIRILRPFGDLPADASAEEISARLSASTTKTPGQEDQNTVAIVINDLSRASYEVLNRWAEVFAKLSTASAAHPLIILSEQDVGLALGQAIKRKNAALQLLILDSVDHSFGDFIDIGKPVTPSSAIPLTIKTLIFNA